MKNTELIKNLPPEQLASIIMCPNETGMAFIPCERNDDCDCYQCCLDWLNREEQKCRVCGCTWSNACPSGCYWVEEDLCSACAEKLKVDEGVR